MADNNNKVLTTTFKYATDQNSQQKIVDANKKIGKSFEDLQKSFKQKGFFTDEELDQAAKLAEAEIRRLNLIKQQSDQIRQQGRLMRLEARVMKETAQDIEMVSRPMLALGIALSGSILASAANYISKTKDANAITEKWKQNTFLLEQSQERIGKIAAQTILPYYTKLVGLAEKVAGFIEKNPEVLEAGLKIGAITAGIGVIGMAVSKGIRFFADQKMQDAANKMLLAAQLMNGAADKELEATGIQKAGLLSKLTTGATGTTGVAAGLTSPLGVTALAVGAFAAASKFDDELKKLENTLLKSGKAGAITATFLDNLATVIGGSSMPILGLVRNFKLLKEEAQGLLERLGFGKKNGNDSAADIKTSLENSPARDQIVDAYIKMQETEKNIVQEYADKRMKILENEKEKEDALRSSHSGNITNINLSANKQIDSATSAYIASQKQAELNNAKERARIIKDGGKEIAKIEADLQDRLRKMAKEHSNRLDDLIAARDALGIVKEQRAYEDKRKEEIDNTNKEIAERRRDIAQRLQDITDSYNQERAQRLLEFQQRIAEINANRAEQLKAEQEHYNAELKQLRTAAAKEIKENDIAKQQELAHNRQAFIASVRQLDASLIGESKLKQKYYALMLADADKYLAAYRKKFNDIFSASSLGTASGGTAGHSTGGYATGKINTGEKGIEYVMPHNLTKLAENILGTSISNEALTSLLLRAKGNSIVVNDNSRWNSRIPAQDRRERQREFRKMMLEVLG